MTLRVYFDSSAVMKLIRDEPCSADVERWMRDESVEAVAGMLTETEVRRATERHGLSQDDATAALGHLAMFGHPDWEFKAAGVMPGGSLRSLDALHVAAALRIEADALITYDDRMAEAAVAMGLAVIQPGVGDREGESRTSGSLDGR